MEAKRFKVLCDFLEGALNLAAAARDSTPVKAARDILNDPEWFNNSIPEYDSFWDASREDFRRALEKIASEAELKEEKITKCSES